MFPFAEKQNPQHQKKNQCSPNVCFEANKKNNEVMIASIIKTIKSINLI